jgi:hypothetical protein
VRFQVSAAGSGRALRFSVQEGGCWWPAAGDAWCPNGLRPRRGPQLPAGIVDIPLRLKNPGGLCLLQPGARPVGLRALGLLRSAARVRAAGSRHPVPYRCVVTRRLNLQELEGYQPGLW